MPSPPQTAALMSQTDSATEPTYAERMPEKNEKAPASRGVGMMSGLAREDGMGEGQSTELLF